MGTSRSQRGVLALTSVAALMVSRDVQVVTTALPVITPWWRRWRGGPMAAGPETPHS